MRWLEDAKKRYNPNDYDYGWGANGSSDTDNPKNGYIDIDCSHLISNVLREAGYNVGYMTTGQLNSDMSQKYYDRITSADQIKPGDVIVFMGHAGIVESYDPTTKTGTFFHSEGYADGPTTSPFTLNSDSNTSGYYYGDEISVTEILRPKQSGSPEAGGGFMCYTPFLPDFGGGGGSGSGGSGDGSGGSGSGGSGGSGGSKSPYDGARDGFNGGKNVPVPTPTSPIILDLDGDGVETTNVKAGAYFDHDGNGFSEQTGWAAPDDGMLVMDRDGNGTIDNGKELFGNETLLADGTKASNGFQALSELDSNADGKIDVNDAAVASFQLSAK